MPWLEGRSSCCHTQIEWIAVDALLSFACPLRATSVATRRGLLHTHTLHVLHYMYAGEGLLRWPAGRTAQMTMPFGYVADGRCFIRFVNPPCPCSAP
jgi:hypothetical protein